MNHSNIAHECQHSLISPLTLKTCSQSNGVNERGAMKSRSASQAAVAGRTTWHREERKAVTTMKPGSNPSCVSLLAAPLRAPLHVCSRLSPLPCRFPCNLRLPCALITLTYMHDRGDIQRCASVRETGAFLTHSDAAFPCCPVGSVQASSPQADVVMATWADWWLGWGAVMSVTSFCSRDNRTGVSAAISALQLGKRGRENTKDGKWEC